MTAVFIISAPSGSGKSTLVNNVRKLIPDLEFSVSYTTRAPRGIENYCKYDYILVNDRLDESTENLKSILIAERLKRSGQRVADDSVRRRAESCRLDNVRERLKPILASFASTAVPAGN